MATPKREPICWLGIDRGIYNLAAYAVTDDTGRAVKVGRISGRQLRHVQRQEERRVAGAQNRGKITRGWARRRAWADEAVHVACNEIVQLAVEHRARVVLEDLKSLSAIRRRIRVPGKRRGGLNKLLNRVQYEKLKAVLLYKLGEHGLPAPSCRASRVHEHDMPRMRTCGKGEPAQRDPEPTASSGGIQMRLVRHEAHADENAARVIAIKGLWFTSLPTRNERAGRRCRMS